MNAHFVGREGEIARIREALGAAIDGKGSCILVSGEPGIGKTRLVEETEARARAMGFSVLRGACSAESARPFLPLSQALGHSLFNTSKSVSFAQVLAISRNGALAAKASPPGISVFDADAMAGMLSAVHGFVADSFSGQQGALGRLEYGGMTVLIERARDLTLAAVSPAGESLEMRASLRSAVQRLDEETSQLPDIIKGAPEPMQHVQGAVTALAACRFTPPRDMESVKLENERIQIANSVMERLSSLSASKPMLVVLEDIHWADEGSLFVMQYLARNLRKARAVLVCTVRPSEGPEAQSAIADMRAEGTITEMSLSGLTLAMVVGIIDAAFPSNSFPHSFPERVHRDCAGNPMFVNEVLRQMVADGAIVSSGGGHALSTAEYSMPSTIEDVVRRRLASLDPDALAFAEYASCIGREFQIEAALSVPTLRDAQGAAGKMGESGIIQISSERGTFIHALFQSSVYSGISTAWRAAHHRSIGEWYERAHAGNLGEAVYDLARHFSLSGEHAKAYEYCSRAGEKAGVAYAAERAISFFADALRALKLAREVQGADVKASEIHEKIGDLSMLLGNFPIAIENYGMAERGFAENIALARLKRKAADAQFRLGEFDAVLELVSRAKELIGERPDRELGRIFVSESYVRIGRGENDKGFSALENALRIFRERGGTGSDVGNTLRGIGNIHWRRGDMDAAKGYYLKSLEEMERADDLPGTAAALNNLGLVSADMGEHEAALDYYGRAVDAMQRTGNRYMLTMVYNNMGLLYKDRAHFDLGLEYFQRSLELRESIGDRSGTAQGLVNLGNLYGIMGKHDEAVAALERSLQIGKAIGEKKTIASTLNALGYMRFNQGNFGEALDLCQQSIRLCEEIGEKYTLAHAHDNIGLIMLERDEPLGALEHFNMSMNLRVEMGDRNDFSWTHYELATAYLKLGDLQASMKHAEESRRLAKEVGLGLEDGASLMVLGMIRRAMGEYDAALSLLEEARGKFAGRKLAHLHADVTYEIGVLHETKGDRVLAKKFYSESLADYLNMDMKFFIRKVEKALEGLR